MYPTSVFSFFISGVAQDIGELTSERLNKLSLTLTTQSEVRELGIEGLGLPSEHIDRHLTDHSNDIAVAAYYMIYYWCKSQENRTIAYQRMCKALKRVGMNFKINEALQ